jgi:Rps23 Pro-64 3,4-dihydroxylase Tpa1-like proline 4-hydroxylase
MKQKPKSILIEDRFLKEAKNLRAVFDKKFKDPRKTENHRFVWDFWHIPDQYTLLRTPARAYFPKALFSKLEKRLLDYAKTHLGLSGISEPWLSCYVDGCSQNLHADNPHGPWAFVYSLTPWEEREFLGGETIIAKDKLLSYWPNFSSHRGDEWEDLFESHPAKFNRLIVFDPRLPHGVKEVKGVKSPAQGRLVIHGWFTEPRPFLEGALSKNQYTKINESILNEQLSQLSNELAPLKSLHGTLSVRVKISSQGLVQSGRILTHTLISRENVKDETPAKTAIEMIFKSLGKLKFPKTRGKSELTIPFLFR